MDHKPIGPSVRNLSFALLVLFAPNIMQVSSGRISGSGVRARSTIEKMHTNLTHVPANDDIFNVYSLNLGYNMIRQLQDQEFIENNYRNVRKVFMWHNGLQLVGKEAFQGLRQLKSLDLSDNALQYLDPNTFYNNVKLTQLFLANNQLQFRKDAVFLFSFSVETLILSNNDIGDVYANTFAGLPNLKRLILSNNRQLRTLAPTCFFSANKLRYLSLSNTAIAKLTDNMFTKLPSLINLDGTPLGNSFEPPLKQITAQGITKLLRIEQFVVF